MGLKYTMRGPGDPGNWPISFSELLIVKEPLKKNENHMPFGLRIYLDPPSESEIEDLWGVLGLKYNVNGQK